MDMPATAEWFYLCPQGIPLAEPAANATPMVLDARFTAHGAWAGVAVLIEQAVSELEACQQHELLARHNYELHMALAHHRQRFPLRYASLTDGARGAEKTRNFPLDRAYRLVHGLIDLLIEWRCLCAPDQPWQLLVRGFEDSQHLASRFFFELARRGAPTGLSLLVETSEGHTALSQRSRLLRVMPAPAGIGSLELAPLAPMRLDGKRRQALEALVASNQMEQVELYYPELLEDYRQKNEPFQAALLSLKVLCMYNHFGYYHESALFADTVLPHIEALVGDDQFKRWNYVGSIFMALVMTDHVGQARQIMERVVETRLTQPDLCSRMCYMLSMLHLRYAKTPDMGRAETYLLAAIEYIEQARGGIEEDEYHFLKVFLDNGLAFLRVRQGRPQEALALCQSGYAVLTATLGGHAHRLHRSVLQYNSAQVYAQLGQSAQALDHYAKSIEMDPYYSEYYNESANILQRERRYTEALAVYDQAITYSAPYPEVYFNKAICHAQLEQWQDALAAFERSLELNPQQPDALLARAEVWEALGCEDEALADYDAVIDFPSPAVTALVNRAVIHFNRGDSQAALHDMDAVISLEGQAEHYENRAEIHKAMNHQDLYQRDLALAASCRAAA